MTEDQDRALQIEIAEEKAATLTRLCARLEAALAALSSTAVNQDLPSAAPPELLDEAAEALWYVVIQREAMGLTDHEWLFRAYAVPAPIQRRMGPKRRA